MNQLTGFTEAVLQEAPRFTLEDRFQFRCRPGLPCFTQCCGDVNIFLTPYDVLRLKNALGMPSEEFLERYTLLPITKRQTLPTPLLRMEDNEEKSCPFLTGQGCGVYEDRPWACRMYPLGLASPKEGEGRGEKGKEGEEAFYFVLHEEPCQGFDEEKEWTVREWLEDQGIAPYNEMGELYKELTLHDLFLQGDRLDPQKMDMFYLSVFDLDRFRRFILESSFLDRFEIAEGLVQRLRSDDEELLKFGFQWLRFCLLGERTLKIKETA